VTPSSRLIQRENKNLKAGENCFTAILILSFVFDFVKKLAYILVKG